MVQKNGTGVKWNSGCQRNRIPNENMELKVEWTTEQSDKYRTENGHGTKEVTCN